MARRTHVPQFGNWDANDHMPYTAVFDNARKGKPGNPNDPSDNPDMFGGPGGNGAAPGRRMFNPNDPEDLDAADLHQGSRGRQQPAALPKNAQEPPARKQVAAVGGADPLVRGNPMPTRAAPADHTKRSGSRDSNGNERGIESPSASFHADRSPSHPAANPGRRVPAGASPAWENTRKKSNEGVQNFAPATPNRARPRVPASKPEESSQKGAAALPRFGEWNNQDPGAGDGFTVIFNNARNERKTGGGPVRIPQPESHNDLYGNRSDMGSTDRGNKKWFCCFQPAVHA